METERVNLGFWAEIKKKKDAQGKQGNNSGASEPIFVQAPMADVTDAAFRRIIAKYSRMGEPAVMDASGKILKPAGGPDALWTEFVSADGLMLAPPEGRAKLMRDLLFTDAEGPIIAQFFTSRPDMMERAARLALELGFDGVDINMGCPDRSIEKQGAGAALIKNPKLAQELIRAAKRGATPTAEESRAGRAGAGGKFAGKRALPVSVKTRIGYNHKEEFAPWLTALLETKPAIITIHARTRKEMSAVPARWEHVREAVEMRNALQKMEMEKTLIFGNGDVSDLADACQKAAPTGADGVMLGRAIFGNPWLFDQPKTPSLKEKLEVLVEHTRLFEELLGGSDGVKSFAVMKKHYKAYVNGFDGAAELRARLMETQSAAQVENIVKAYISEHF